MLDVKPIWFEGGNGNCPIKMSEVGLTLCVCVCWVWDREGGKVGNAAATTSLKTVDEVIITLTHTSPLVSLTSSRRYLTWE